MSALAHEPTLALGLQALAVRRALLKAGRLAPTLPGMKDALRRTFGIVFAAIFFASGLALGGELQVALVLMSGAAFLSAVS